MTTADAEENSPGRLGMTIQNIGLCLECGHAIPTTGPRALFIRCGLAKGDAAYPRYPVLPVTACRGFAERLSQS